MVLLHALVALRDEGALQLAGVAHVNHQLRDQVVVLRRDPISLLAFGFFFACLLWTVVQPWWSLPWHVLDADVSLQGNLAGAHVPEWALVAWIVLLGTVVPFILVVGALQHLPATRVAISGMLEPVVATVVAYGWLDETLAPAQLVGGALVLAAIALAQTAR